jgi:hypothetical protein
MNRLARHLAWHVERRFLLQHPLLSVRIGFDAAREAARFTIADKFGRTKNRDDEP